MRRSKNVWPYFAAERGKLGYGENERTSYSDGTDGKGGLILTQFLRLTWFLSLHATGSNKSRKLLAGERPAQAPAASFSETPDKSKLMTYSVRTLQMRGNYGRIAFSNNQN
jgi:hypothetical protein